MTKEQEVEALLSESADVDSTMRGDSPSDEMWEDALDILYLGSLILPCILLMLALAKNLAG